MSFRGIAPELLYQQVQNTASWILDRSDVPAAQVLANVVPAQDAWRQSTDSLVYLRYMLAAHFTTVATFVPTDVDTHIRHHVWQRLEADALREAVAILDEVASWDVRAVSARVVTLPSGALLYGHAGEWLSVRAGALGRALLIGAQDVADTLIERIDAELAHEANAFETLSRDKNLTFDALRAATTLAHNLGDLSRVVEAWPRRDITGKTRDRYARLGHERSEIFGDAFFRAGFVNKQVMAIENHRFLPLRKPRGLRRDRALILPIGPFFDDWGATLAKHPALEDRDRGEVVEALIEIHQRDPAQQGCLRALSALGDATAGGLDVYAEYLPARIRKTIREGAIRAAARTPRAEFEARFEKRGRALLSGAGA